MKIENSSIAIHSEHELKYQTSVRFESLLESETPIFPSVQRLDDEHALIDRLHCALIQQLLALLQGSMCRCGGYESLRNMEQEYELQPYRRIHDETITQTTAISETLEVAMKGKIQTEKGSVEIDLFLGLSRSFVQNRTLSKEDLIDPLVINFSGEMPSLSSTTFHFDIDCDGEADQISTLMDGNAFLGWDRNGNGTIDDGRELFGAQSGNGFAELGEHDSDNNNWIDENDPFFDKLRIWTVSQNEKRLIGLGEAGIGAIYLGQARSPFLLSDENNTTLGRIRSSGLYLQDNGTAGILAQLDLKKHSPKSEEPRNVLAEALWAV